MRRSFAIAIAFLGIASCVSGCTSLPTETARDATGTRIEVASEGAGTTVVFEAGLGDGLDTWSRVWPGLTGTGRLFAYSRPGYGRSAAVSRPRDPCTIAHELHALLRDRGLRPPYVLVGHSIGGLYQWVYATLYPDEVAALVLLDPTHPDHWTRLQQDTPATAATLRAMRTLFTSTMRSEFDAQRECLARIDRTRARAIPTRLLVRTEYAPIEGAGFRSTVEALQQEWLGLVGAASPEPVSGATHYIQRDRPDAVVAAIRAAIAASGDGAR